MKGVMRNTIGLYIFGLFLGPLLAQQTFNVQLSVRTFPSLPLPYGKPAKIVCEAGEFNGVGGDGTTGAGLTLDEWNITDCMMWWAVHTTKISGKVPGSVKIHLTGAEDLPAENTLHVRRVTDEMEGEYTCHLTCGGDQSIERTLFLITNQRATVTKPPSPSSDRPSTRRKHVPKTTVDPLCGDYYCLGDEQTTTTLAGVIALLVILGISILGCIVAFGQTKGICRNSRYCQSPDIEPEAESPCTPPPFSVDPPKYEDVVAQSPPPVGIYTLFFSDTPPSSPRANNTSQLISDTPSEPVSAATEPTTDAASDGGSGNRSSGTWGTLPSYLQVVRDWAARGITVSTEMLGIPPPKYCDVEKMVACATSEGQSNIEKKEENTQNKEEDLAEVHTPNQSNPLRISTV